MKRRTITRLQIVALMVFSVVLTADAKDNPNDRLKKYAKAADEMAVTMNSMIKTKRSLARESCLTPAEELDLTKGMLIANEAIAVFNRRVKSLTAAPDDTVSAELRPLLNNVKSSIDDLNSQAVVGVTDPKARQKLARFIGKFKAAIAFFSSI